MTYRVALLPGDGVGPEVIAEARKAMILASANASTSPAIAGRGIANPCGAIWSASLMLDHLGGARPRRD